MGEILNFEAYTKNAEVAAAEEVEFEPSDELMKTQENFLSCLYALELPSANTDELSNLNKKGVMRAYLDGFENGCEEGRINTEIAFEESEKRNALSPILGSKAFREMFDKIAADMPELFDGVDIDDLSEPAVKLLREKAEEAVRATRTASKRSQGMFFEAVVKNAIETVSDDQKTLAEDDEGLEAIMSYIDKMTAEIDRAVSSMEEKEKLAVMVDILCCDVLQFWAARGCRYGYAAGIEAAKGTA